MAAFILTIVLLIIYGIIRLCKWADIPWVTAQGGRYRIYKVHGSHIWKAWEYRLQERSFFCWSNVEDEYDTDKDSDLYNKWIKKYKMEKQKNYWN